MVVNMTEGNPTKVLVAFSLPMLFSSMFQQLYNIIDSVIAGKYVGSLALAAIGASYPIVMIFMAIAGGSSIGVSVIVAMLFGGNRFKELKTSVSTSIISIVGVGVILTVAGIIFCAPMLNLLNTPNDIFKDSSLYLSIYVYGLPFLFLYNVCNGIFTALGDSKTPLVLLICSSIGNIILDLVFVIVFKMGVSGVAWATFLAQGVSSLLSFLILLKRIHTFKTDEKPELFSMQMLGKITRFAIPSILQQSFISVGNLFVQTLVNSFGSNVIAGYSAAIKLNTFAMTSFAMMSNGMSSYTSQNIGANRMDRVSQGAKACLKMTMIIAIPFVIIFEFFGSFFMGLFLDSGENSQAVLDVGNTFLRIVSPFYLVISIKIVVDGLLRGAGIMGAFLISTFADLILRVVFAFILARFFDSTGIWLSWPVGWIIAMVLSVIFYFSGIWKKPHKV